MKRILSVFGLSLSLNFIWEISQAFLYAPHYAGISGLIFVHLRASLGDTMMVLLVLFLDAILFKDHSKEKNNSRRILSIMIIGFMSAILVEKYALSAGRWSYGSLMPIIPWINVGLAPILQMVLIPPAVAVFWSRLK